MINSIKIPIFLMLIVLAPTQLLAMESSIMPSTSTVEEDIQNNNTNDMTNEILTTANNLESFKNSLKTLGLYINKPILTTNRESFKNYLLEQHKLKFSDSKELLIDDDIIEKLIKSYEYNRALKLCWAFKCPHCCKPVSTEFVNTQESLKKFFLNHLTREHKLSIPKNDSDEIFDQNPMELKLRSWGSSTRQFLFLSPAKENKLHDIINKRNLIQNNMLPQNSIDITSSIESHLLSSPIHSNKTISTVQQNQNQEEQVLYVTFLNEIEYPSDAAQQEQNQEEQELHVTFLNEIEYVKMPNNKKLRIQDTR